MKNSLLLLLSLVFIKAHAQNATILKEIDSIANVINNSKSTTQTDSIFQDMSGIGMTMKTYLTIKFDGSDLKKYVNKVFMERKENGVTTKTITSSSFYFHNNELIKVEEFGIEGDEKKGADWYYANNQPIHNTFTADNADEHASLLLSIAKTLQQKFKTLH